MKNILAIIVITSTVGLSQGFSFNGNVNYLKQDDQSFVSNNGAEYSLKLYENCKYAITISNALDVDLDHFKNEIKETNVFTTLKVEF